MPMPGADAALGQRHSLDAIQFVLEPLFGPPILLNSNWLHIISGNGTVARHPNVALGRAHMQSGILVDGS